MKNPLRLLALFCMIPFLANAQYRGTNLFHHQGKQSIQPTSNGNGTSAAKVAEHEDFPELMLNFNWVDSTSSWDSIARTTFTYSSTGNVLESLYEYYSLTGFLPSSRQISFYNAQGWRSEFIFQNWNGSIWTNQYRSTESYDAFGNSSIDISYNWNGSAWDSSSGRRSTFAYVFTDKVAEEVVEYWDQQNPIWELGERANIHWPNAQGWDTISYEEYNSGWTPTERVVIFGWHNFGKEFPDSAIIQNFNGSAWETDETMGVTYGAYDSYVWTYYQWLSNTWVAYDRSIANLDMHDHEVLNEGYEWNAGWIQNYGNKSIYSYDLQGRTTEIVYEYWDQGAYARDGKAVFPSFFTGQPGPVSPVVDVTAYPNPCSDRLNFKFEGANNGPTRIALYDLQGRLRTETLSPRSIDQQVTMPISEFLENGTYLYRISTKEGVTEGKVVVQR